MRIILIGGFIDYEIQLANHVVNHISEKNTIMLVLPSSDIIQEYLENIDARVNIRILHNPVYNPKNLNLFREIRRFRPDIVHLQIGSPVMALLVLLLRNYPIVSTFHDARPHEGEESKIKNFARYIIRKYSNKIIVHGNKLKKQMIKEYNIYDDKIRTIQICEHEVAPFKKYEKKFFPEEEYLVLFFGRIYKYKGLDYLIKAAPLVKKHIPLVKFIIAGTGEDFKKYEEMITEKDIFIIYNRHISYKEGAELFQKCSLVVLPYIDASQSGVIPTAYSFKKPVIVTNVGSIPEIVDNGITGLIVPSRDHEALADAIVLLLKDRKLRIRMGENAYIKLKTDLSWNKIIDDIFDIYRDTIKKSLKNECLRQ